MLADAPPALRHHRRGPAAAAVAGDGGSAESARHRYEAARRCAAQRQGAANDGCLVGCGGLDQRVQRSIGDRRGQTQRRHGRPRWRRCRRRSRSASARSSTGRSCWRRPLRRAPSVSTEDATVQAPRGVAALLSDFCTIACACCMLGRYASVHIRSRGHHGRPCVVDRRGGHYGRAGRLGPPPQQPRPVRRRRRHVRAPRSIWGRQPRTESAALLARPSDPTAGRSAWSRRWPAGGSRLCSCGSSYPAP